MDTIYDAIGGQAALEAAVLRFYERVTADPDLAYFFVDMDMRKLKAHQVAFLGRALGGPMHYGGAGMQRAHAHLSIEQRHFDGDRSSSNCHLAGVCCARCANRCHRRTNRSSGYADREHGLDADGWSGLIPMS
jgi:hypothetical protein